MASMLLRTVPVISKTGKGCVVKQTDGQEISDLIMIIIMTQKSAMHCALCCELSPTCMPTSPGCNCVQIICNTSGTCHLQHVMCHVMPRNSSAINFDRAEITFSFSCTSFPETIN